MIALRPHQVEAVAAVEGDWIRGVGRTAIVHATGTGKTTTFAEIIGRWLERNPRRRAIVGAHRVELIEQAASRLARQLGTSVGVVMGQRNQTLPRVIMASVPTLRSERRRRMIRDVGLVVIDECHHAAADSYLDVLRHYGAMDDNGGAVALGVTATMSRGDQRILGDVWQNVAHVYGTPDAIRDGWLKRPVGIAVRVADLDLRRVRTKAGGDYADGALGAAIEGSLAPKRIAEAVREHAADRQGFVFAPTVHSAEVIRDVLRDEGFTAELVHAGTPADERRRVVQGFRDGRVQWLCNCGVFTEGTDLPQASVVVIARPTTHSGLYVQMAGRGLRLWCPVHGEDAGNLLTPCCAAEHRSALVLDVVGASRRHSLAARIELFGAEAAAAIEDEFEGEVIDDDALVLDDEVEIGPSGTMAEDPDYLDGNLAYDVVDLFGSSDMAWARTTAGVWFLEAGQRYIAILPSPQGWPKMDVIGMDRHQHGTGHWIARGVQSLADAMGTADASVAAGERLTARRARSWRAGRPSDAQLRIARQCGVATDGTAGEVAQRISVVLASQRIDPYIPAYVWQTGSIS